MTSGNNNHGGRREGAGRPKGSRMRRSDQFADELLSRGKCPIDALVRLAEQSEASGNLAQAIGAWKSIIPYVYPKPKAVEFEPEKVIELAAAMAAARAEASRLGVREDHFDLVEKMVKRFELEQFPLSKFD